MIKYETDSRLIQTGQIFVAIKGVTVDGHDYIASAIEKGASKIIMQKDIACDIPFEVVPDTSKYIKERLVEEYSNEFKDLKIIGLTGTNGKTTTCFLIYQMLKELGKKVCYIGTIGFYLNDEVREIANTTPDILSLYKLLKEAVVSDVEYVVMEVSSHALAFERAAGLKFNIAGFTNLTQDHLDYHKTMDNYLSDKKKILNQLTNDGTIIINDDDSYGKYFKEKNYLTVGNNGDYKIIDVEYKLANTDITFEYQNNVYNITTNLVSDFNVYNYLLALAIIHNLNFDIEKIINITSFIYAPKGRCEMIKVKDSYVVIDYAHTPDAVEKVIKSYTKTKKANLITIVGCGGNRDRKKRPIMGNISANLSDYAIFTSDNPRNENPESILEDVVAEIQTKNYEVIVDRKEAILKGLNMLKKDDYLLILGKGHEDYQIIGNKKIHFSDAEIVENYNN